MTAPRCSVCYNGVALVRYVDAAPDLTASALSRQAEAMGMDLSAERILTHRKHRKNEAPASIAKTKADFAILVRDRAIQQFEAGELDLANGATVGGINSGLGAQKIIDGREKVKGSNGTAELAFAIIEMLGGRRTLELDDGLTIDGEAVEVG